MTDPQQDTLIRAVAGDREALAGLLERHAPAVRERLAGAIPPRWQSTLSIDDALQQTYADAFLDICRFDPGGSASFATWLKTLAHRNLIDAIRALEAEKRGGGRQRMTGPGASLEELCDRIGVTATSPSQAARRGEAGEELRRAIERLPAVQREVVRAFDLEGRPAEEIGGAMNRSVGAVYMLRARAHRRLRELLGSPSDFLSRG
jgi:RNA polymerase sigma factor (sigma-70 family)